MAQDTPPDFSQYKLLPAAPAPTTKERSASAEASVAEAEAPYAGRKAAASAALAEAQARRVAAQAEADEAKAKTVADKQAAADAAKGRDSAERMQTLGAYLGQLQRARDVISSGIATGPAGQLTGGVWGTPAADLKGILESIANPIVLEAMAEARKGSAQGATGFGALSQKELELLKGKFGSLRQSQDPESLLHTIDEIEQSYRRLMAYNAGYDPYTSEGAAIAGLPSPEIKAPEPRGEISAAGGEWVEDPELRGLDASITSMIKAGRSGDQIRQWLDEYQPGLGARVEGLDDQIRYFKQTGKVQVNPNFGKTFVPAEPTILGQLGDSPLGAGVVAAADQIASGLLGEAAAGQMSGEDYERTAAVMRGLRDKYPTASMFGDVLGGIGATVGGMASLGRMGLKLPSLLEGVGQEVLYGIGSSEPGQRVEGGISSAVMAPATNLFGKVGSDAIGAVLRGADPERAALTEKYGIDLTPGQLTGRTGERDLAGMPILGPQVTERRNETLEQFNQAAFGEALAPIGGRSTAIGQRGIAEAQQAVSDAYDAALGGRAFQFDQPFVQAVRGKPYAALVNMKGETGPKLAAEVDRILNEVNVNGTVDGRAWQQARRQLVDLQAKSAVKDDIASETILDNLGDIVDAFDGLVQRQAPDAYDGYMAANSAYRNVKILERAVDNASGGDVFGPGNLRVSTKLNTQKFGGSAASARGDRPFNDLVMGSLGVIPEKVDDASIMGRIAAPAIGGGSFGAAATAGMLTAPENDKVVDEGDGTVPPWLLAAAAGAGLATLPYSRRGIRLTNRPLLGPRTDRQRQLGEMLQTYGPAALRGATRDAEPDAPMPQEFGYSKVGSPDFRKIVELAAANAQPLSSEEQTALSGDTFVNVDAAGNTLPQQGGMSIDGRPVERDPVTGEMVFTDTGEPVPGFAEGGQVSFQQRQRAQQERIAAQRRAQEQQMAQARDARVAPAQARAAANGNRRTTAPDRPKTSHMTDIAMAASRRGNDLVAALADLTDRYIKPADAVAWLAQNVEGRSPEEVARIRQNLQPISSMRSVVEAGAAENERRFAAAGGLGARTGDDVVPPVRLAAAAYRPQDIMPALASETPRAMDAVGQYFRNNSMGDIANDAVSAGRSGYESFMRDPYGIMFENALYATPATALAAAPFDYAAMREGSQMLAPYAGEDREAASAKRMVDALSVLPGMAVIPGAAPVARRALSARRKGR